MSNNTVFVDGDKLTPLPPADERWNNNSWLADKSQRRLPKPLRQEVLSAVAAESQRLRRPLTDDERNAVYQRFD
jgi:hypothetical protein